MTSMGVAKPKSSLKGFLKEVLFVVSNLFCQKIEQAIWWQQLRNNHGAARRTRLISIYLLIII
jgi:hypothetical protein